MQLWEVMKSSMHKQLTLWLRGHSGADCGGVEYAYHHVGKTLRYLGCYSLHPHLPNATKNLLPCHGHYLVPISEKLTWK
jgi:hypothetical protein